MEAMLSLLARGNRPTRATMQPRGQRLRPPLHNLLAIREELSKMHELLHGHSNRTCVSLYGLGGIGKTQLAIESIRRHKEKYTAIFWLNANVLDSLKLSLRDATQQVLKYHPSTSLLAGVDLDDLDRLVYAVKA